MTRRLLRIVVALCALAFALTATGCMSTPNSGEVGVIRNGGPFDNKNIRGCDGKADTDPCGILKNGSGNTWVGVASTVHYYPMSTQQRFYKAEACFGRDVKGCTADRGPYFIQTKDGVDLGVEGTFFLNTTFDDSPQGAAAVKAFDKQFATRTFNGDHAYDGTAGWTNFLGAIVDPVASNNLRDIGSGLECADFVSSCSLVQNQGNKGKDAANKPVNKDNQSNVQRVQQAVSEGLGTDLVNTLGGSKETKFFDSIKFVITKVDLPSKIQVAINDAQASFAQVSQVNAQVAQATAQVDVAHQKYLANLEREKGYNACHSCARQDELARLPSSLNTLVFGSGVAPISIGGK